MENSAPDNPTDRFDLNSPGARQEFLSNCCCPSNMDRRSFLRLVGAGSFAAMALPVMAGPFDNPNFDANIPADKKLDPDWVKALFTRGVPEVYHGAQLNNIGMPIGGICAGHVYLSGDGAMTRCRLTDNATPFDQGFALRTVSGEKTAIHHLGRQDFPEMTFRGEYPIAKIEYKNAAIPVRTNLEVFSPFIPLNAEDSGKPAVIFNFTLKNTSDSPVTASLAGGLQNAVCLKNNFGALASHKNQIVRDGALMAGAGVEVVEATRRNQILRDSGSTILSCSVEAIPPGTVPPAPNTPGSRPDIVFEDWTKPAFAGWTVEGTAFGPGPFDRQRIEARLGKIGGEGSHMVNSYFPKDSDKGTGKLTSAPFSIERNYIKAWIAGGTFEGKTCVNLVVDGKVVQSQTGGGVDRLMLHYFDVTALQGKQATLEIVDASEESWGQIGVGQIAFTDAMAAGTPLKEFTDYGTMALGLLGAPAEIGIADGSIGFDGTPSDDFSAPLSRKLIGALGRTVELKPGESATVTFVVAWHFPNLQMERLGEVGRYYAGKFDSAKAVVADIATNFDKLAGATRLWRDTWYDSTLPYWFLDRTLLNVSTLATSGCYRFADGRFWAWEGGAGCCAGTCTHVWQYAHSMSRIFPELERDTRERVDLGISLHRDTGVMGFRGEFDMGLAVDGQAGTLLRIYREHQMAPDNAFLKRNWDKIKTAYKPLFALDSDEDGIMEGAQMNTLDRPWFGQVSWMSSMYVAALRAGEQMAREMADAEFEQRCARIAAAGTKNLTTRLFNGEYFFNIIDPKHTDAVNSGDGSHIDQVYGQSWAFQVGLPRILPEKETRSALRSLWKYNFSPDAGAYFTAHQPGRRFVNAGDAGMIMCTFPRTDWDYVKASGGNPNHSGYAYYFVETWTGNEYQVASHMLWEGMKLEPMAMIRAIHDRYNPLKRNPWSEIECGEHYSRAMAGHGAFIAMCGFEHHGPLGHIGFAPRLNPENFRAPFTAAEGWGTYAQTIKSGKLDASIEVKTGRLRLSTMSLAMDPAPAAPTAKVILNGASTAVPCVVTDGRLQLSFPSGIVIPERQKLTIEIA